jgi:hypothetical protein
MLFVLVIGADFRAAAGIGLQSFLCASLDGHRELSDLLHTNAVQTLSRTLRDAITLALCALRLLSHCLVVKHEHKAVCGVKAAAVADSDMAAMHTPTAGPSRGRELSP